MKKHKLAAVAALMALCVWLPLAVTFISCPRMSGSTGDLWFGFALSEDSRQIHVPVQNALISGGIAVDQQETARLENWRDTVEDLRRTESVITLLLLSLSLGTVLLIHTVKTTEKGWPWVCLAGNLMLTLQTQNLTGSLRHLRYLTARLTHGDTVYLYHLPVLPLLAVAGLTVSMGIMLVRSVCSAGQRFHPAVRWGLCVCMVVAYSMGPVAVWLSIQETLL